MNMQAVQYFVEICKYKSYSKAAENLFISQQALSRHIKKLEADLGHKLFYRTSYGIRLTLFGEDFLAAAIPVVNSFENLSKLGGIISQKDKKDIVIGTSIPGLFSNWLNNQIEAFQMENPECRIELVSREIKELTGMLQRGLIDIAFLICAADEFEDKRFLQHVIKEHSVMLCINTENAAAKKSSVEWKDIENLKLFMTAKDNPFSIQVEKQCHAFGFSPNVSFRSVYTHTILDYVSKHGNAATIIPDFESERITLEYPNIVALSIVPEMKIRLAALTRTDFSAARYISSFISKTKSKISTLNSLEM